MRAEDQLAAFIARFTPAIAACTEDVLAKLRARMPSATQLVYDNYNALVIGFGPNERASDAIFSIAIYSRWINLFFLQAVRQRLADPDHLLRGDGTMVRHLRIDDAATLDDRAVLALIEQSLAQARVPLFQDAPARIVIRAIAAKWRVRRPS
ncbi:MAG: hypothetical protein ACR2GP_07145 [Burkholderiaceae bacterium]